MHVLQSRADYFLVRVEHYASYCSNKQNVDLFTFTTTFAVCRFVAHLELVTSIKPRVGILCHSNAWRLVQSCVLGPCQGPPVPAKAGSKRAYHAMH